MHVESQTEQIHDDDLKEALQERKRRDSIRDCPSCGQPYTPVNKWHRFCSETCRNQYHNARADVFKERHLVEVERLKNDNAELVQENSRLRKEILEQDQLIKKLKE